MNHTIVNMAHSARERLKNMAKASGRDADYLFQRYAFERFFYRIGQSPHAGRFILKGASLFTLLGRILSDFCHLLIAPRIRFD